MELTKPVVTNRISLFCVTIANYWRLVNFIEKRSCLALFWRCNVEGHM